MEWKTVKLGKVCDLIKNREKGVLIDKSNYVSTENMLPNKGGVVPSSITPYDGAIIYHPKDVLISNIRPYFKKIWFADKIGGCSGDVLCFRSNSKIDSTYLYYLLSQDSFFDYVMAGSKGTKMPRGDKGQIMQYEFSLPPLDTQRRIAAILSSLDDKIENNNRINRNLEAQAQALFKSWFVDFEPWGGIMPDDWKEGVYNDIIEKTISGDWGKERPEGNYDHSVACIRGCDFEDINNGIRGKTPQRYILEKNYQNKGLNNRDIVVEISGGTATVSTGRVCLITEKLLQKYDYDIVCTNFCRTIRPLADYYTYLYYSWKYKYDQRIMFGYENGTSGIKNFAIKDFIEKEPLIIPSCDVVKSFNKVISVLHDKSQENGTESSRLADLRDTLLPKLMKGEIEL